MEGAYDFGSCKNNALKYEDEVVYRKRSSMIECIHEFNQATGKRIRTTYFDYFDDKKVKSIEEYDQETGKRVKSTNFVLFKSVHEYDPITGKKSRQPILILEMINGLHRSMNIIRSSVIYHGF